MVHFSPALNQRSGKVETVPSQWVDNPHIFHGNFVTPPTADGDEPPAPLEPAPASKTPPPVGED